MTAEPQGDLRQRGHMTSDPVFLLIRAGAVGRARGNAVLAQLGIKTRHYSVLATAATCAVSQRELADLLLLNPSQVVALVDDLEGRGWIERVVSSHDRRAKLVVATPRGQEVFEEGRELLARTHEVMLAPLSEEERATLLRVLPLLALPADGA